MAKLFRPTTRRRLRKSLCFEQMEDRTLLAANIWITEAYLIDGQGNRLDSPAEGSAVGIVTAFKTQDLPAGSQYVLSMSIDGQEATNTLTWGAGLSGVGSWGHVWGNWCITAGQHAVEVIVDATNSVQETSETDNRFAFSFTNEDLPHPRFRTPLGGVPNRDWYINNYVDIDPPKDLDYRGRSFTYPGHNGHDINIAGVEEEAAGVPLYAAAAGVVVSDQGSVQLDHGGGWTTWYIDMRDDEVAVSVGQYVVASEFLGFMGTHGTGPHLHWGVYYCGTLVEPYLDPQRLLADPLPYAGDVPGIIDFKVGPDGGGNTYRGSEREVYSTSETPYIWLSIHGFITGTREDVVWYRPDGTEHYRVTRTSTSDASGGYQNWIVSLSSQLGTWQIVAEINGLEVARAKFLRTTATLPKVKVTERGTNFTIVEDGTSTPVSFDLARAGGLGPTRTLTVLNVGNDTLNLGPVTLPPGFILVEGLASTLEPGTSDTLTVQADTTTVGVKSGQIRFTTNDADESVFNFPVEGVVLDAIITETGGSTAVAEGGAGDTYAIKLAAQPSADVTVTITPDSQISVFPTSSVFTPANWNTVQTVTVTAVDDTMVEGSHNATIIHAATSTATQNGILLGSVAVNITDNDTVSVTQSGGSTSVMEGAATDTYTVVLTTQPTANVTITVSPNSQVTVSPTTLTFTASNWNIGQTVTVTAVNDSTAEGNHTGTISHTAASSDSNFNAVSIASVTVNITDNDSAGVTIAQSGGSTGVAEGGATDSYTVRLTTQPSANVTITVSPNSQVTVSPTTLTFTTSNWNIAQTVTVTALNDSVAEGNHTGTVSHTAASSDSNYNGISIASVTANITDNDSAGVTIAQSGGSTDVTEGGTTDTYTVVLTTQPTANVTVTVSPNSQVMVSPTTLTFTSINWNTAQAVTVNAVDDDLLEGNHTGTIAHTAASSDPNYSGLVVAGTTVSITDNERDTTPPAAPSIPDLDAASDSGKSNADNITRVLSPIIRGTAEPDSTVELFADGTSLGSTMANGVGSWTFADGSIPEGLLAITAKASGTLSDLAGNSLDGDANGSPGGDYARLLSQGTIRSASRESVLSAIDSLLESGELQLSHRLR